jgi:hypothetical protein
MSSNQVSLDKRFEELKDQCNQMKYKITNDLFMLYSQFDDNKNTLVEMFKDDKSGHNFDYIELIEMNFDIFYHNYNKIKDEIKKARQIQFKIDDIEGKDNYPVNVTEGVR